MINSLFSYCVIFFLLFTFPYNANAGWSSLKKYFWQISHCVCLQKQDSGEEYTLADNEQIPKSNSDNTENQPSPTNLDEECHCSKLTLHDLLLAQKISRAIEMERAKKSLRTGANFHSNTYNIPIEICDKCHKHFDNQQCDKTKDNDTDTKGKKKKAESRIYTIQLG